MAYGLSTALSGADCYLGRLDELKKDGISHLELCLREDYGGQAALYEGALAAIQAAGLTVFSVHLPFGMSVSPACTKQAQRQKNVEKLKRFISLTKGCGAEIFVIHASFEPVEDAAREAMLDSAAQSLRELVDYMEPQGLTLALENLPRTCIGNSAREIAYLTGCVPELRLCLDTNHFTSPHPDVRFRPLKGCFPPCGPNGIRRRKGEFPMRKDLRSRSLQYIFQIMMVSMNATGCPGRALWISREFTRRLPGRDLTLRSCLSRTSGAGESGPLAPGSSAVMKNGKAEPN